MRLLRTFCLDLIALRKSQIGSKQFVVVLVGHSEVGEHCEGLSKADPFSTIHVVVYFCMTIDWSISEIKYGQCFDTSGLLRAIRQMSTGSYSGEASTSSWLFYVGDHFAYGTCIQGHIAKKKKKLLREAIRDEDERFHRST